MAGGRPFASFFDFRITVPGRCSSRVLRKQIADAAPVWPDRLLRCDNVDAATCPAGRRVKRIRPAVDVLAFVRCAELITSSADAVEIKIRPRRICPGCELDLPALRRLSHSLALANVLPTFSAFVAFHH